ncbi:hypothetical protein D6T64_01045 [Cryobacterium melibiosiphilum]|uniref:DUF1648 domain-containing protein n=1 Tax=Cryobacterium melibiosiphilum TaxID=995039 RepID=A0A3A5MRC2_9MICO|nr:hypothetical protein [Cryobacterium melibiosiphilum]RJT91892.1 hypothetical protein D6T64_01045 [Cryobacterium melibiosiphilum]
MMFTRRIFAALLVAVPTVGGGIVVMRWMPLPNPLNVQWSGTEASNTQPLWMFFLPIAALTLCGFALAIAADRDHEDPFRGTTMRVAHCPQAMSHSQFVYFGRPDYSALFPSSVCRWRLA